MRTTILVLLIACVFQSCKNDKKDAIAASSEQRPNIVFIMADDHATQAISAYGHPISQLAPTPNIDRIAKEGAIFKNNFCTNAICGPSRAVILTGKHSHINGFRMNGDRFDGSQQTYPKLLQKAGYKTALVGKWHLHGEPEGFDYWNILQDQGNYYNPNFIAINPETKKVDTTMIQGYATDIVTRDALRYLEKIKDDKQPFMLMVQHKAPHRNWMPALRHLNKYDSVQFPVPDTYFSNHEGSTASKEQYQTIYRDMYEGHDLKMTKEKGSPVLAHNPWVTDFNRMTPEQRTEWDKAYQPKNDAFHDANLKGEALALWKLQRYLQDYMATIAAVDEGVGDILDYLETHNLAKNTIVVYTTDQGFYLGEKGWFDKRFMYEESLAMPMVMKYPAVIEPGTEITALTQNLDLAETFLDFAQVAIPENMQGKSLKPLLVQSVKDDDFRNAIYYHYYDFPAFHMVKKMYGVRTKRYKLIHVYDDVDEWELYDLERDPFETNNVVHDAIYNEIAYLLRRRLGELQQEYGVTDKEFDHASPESIERAYNGFERLRGQPVTAYEH
ncbi:sulfatase [Mariniflexile ostreae]|uniref:Sulfatase n=1 Tax=Mariniflexile ostreae TaxID=1520892 RepID=A0ABV5F9N5_9FLAO